LLSDQLAAHTSCPAIVEQRRKTERDDCKQKLKPHNRETKHKRTEILHRRQWHCDIEKLNEDGNYKMGVLNFASPTALMR